MTVTNGSAEAPRPLKLGGHVGFDSLPDQLVNKSVQGGFSFNILCIGRMIELCRPGVDRVKPWSTVKISPSLFPLDFGLWI